MNTKPEDWKPFLEKNNFTFTNVFDPTNRAIYAKYFVDITPELYVLNKDRIIVAKTCTQSNGRGVSARIQKNEVVIWNISPKKPPMTAQILGSPTIMKCGMTIPGYKLPTER